MSGHKWTNSRVGHGESQCEYCHITSREAAALGLMNICKQAPSPAPSGQIERAAKIIARGTEPGLPVTEAAMQIAIMLDDAGLLSSPPKPVPTEEQIARALQQISERNGGAPYEAIEKHYKEFLFEQARAILSLIPAQGTWRAIETLTEDFKDGRWLLIATDEGSRHVARYRKTMVGNFCWAQEEGSSISENYVKFWMPLPAPPSPVDGKE